MAIADLDKLKGVLGIPTGVVTKADAAMQLAVDAANAEIVQFLCLDPDETVRTYSVRAIARAGRDDRVQAIAICPRPVVSIANVVLLGRTLTEGADFELVGNVVKLCDPCLCPSWYWTQTWRGIGGNECDFFTADVDAGFATVPANLCLAAAHLAAAYYRGGGGAGIKRHKIRNHEIEYATGSADSPLGLGGHWPPMLTMALGRQFRMLKMLTANPV